MSGFNNIGKLGEILGEANSKRDWNSMKLRMGLRMQRDMGTMEHSKRNEAREGRSS